jgi:hypothetical protein
VTLPHQMICACERLAMSAPTRQPERVRLRPDAVPPEVRHLVPAADEWGIADDGYREDKVAEADEESLRRLVALVDEAPDELWSWLVGPEADSEAPSAEYVALTCLTMAADSARLKVSRPQL